MYDFVQQMNSLRSGVGLIKAVASLMHDACRAERTTGKAVIVQDACLWTLFNFISN